jgi:hypothetical protein
MARASATSTTTASPGSREQMKVTTQSSQALLEARVASIDEEIRSLLTQPEPALQPFYGMMLYHLGLDAARPRGGKRGESRLGSRATRQRLGARTRLIAMLTSPLRASATRRPSSANMGRGGRG